MMQIVPNSGPLGRDHLDNLRADALGALDNAEKASVPEALLTYIVALEREYLDRRHRESRASLEALWSVRRDRFDGDTAHD